MMWKNYLDKVFMLDLNVTSKNDNTKSVKCRFKNISEHDKSVFKKSTCLLLVSVGQEAHEGSRFDATVSLINQTFQNCVVSLYDTIQRYTMSFRTQLPPSELKDNAQYEGDLWLIRNSKYLSKLTIPYSTKRWEDWIDHPLYYKHLDLIKSTYKYDYIYRDAFEAATNKYIKRYKSNNLHSAISIARMKNICLDYLMEECAVLSLWSELDYLFEVYPNPHNDAIEATRDIIINKINNKNIRPVTIRFSNAGQLKPQKFYTTNGYVST